MVKEVIHTCMKRPYLFFLMVLVFASRVGFARVGESESRIERRITEGRRGVVLKDEQLNEALRDRNAPLKAFAGAIERAASSAMLTYKHVVYFKRADTDLIRQKDLDSRRMSLPGWDVHVIYVKGRSVAEGYRRAGTGLSEAEVQALLTLQKGGGHWQEVQGMTNEALEPLGLEPKGRLFKPTYLRSDGRLAASVTNATIAFYDVDFHRNLKLMLIAAETDLAPVSVSGF